MKEKDLYILKIGTNALIDDNGSVRDFILSEILDVATKVLQRGDHILVVTSGAVRLGRSMLGDLKASKTIAASVGQPTLFGYYQKKAKELNVTLAEFLLTRPYIVRRQQFLTLQKTYTELFEKGIVPIVNENDAIVSGTDWSFGDNDSMAAALAVSLKAKKLVIASHIDGLFDQDPTQNKDAKIISKVDNISDEFLKYCSKNVSSNGSGGMLSKLKAARICSAVGIETQIINGLVGENISKALSNEQVGTYFEPRKVNEKISNRERWILAAKNSAGSVEIDDGAVKALRSGMSLLAVGVKRTYGQFEAKEVIEIIDKNSHGVAFGIVDMSKTEIESVLRENTHKKQLVHANNMFILK